MYFCNIQSGSGALFWCQTPSYSIQTYSQIFFFTLTVTYILHVNVVSSGYAALILSKRMQQNGLCNKYLIFSSSSLSSPATAEIMNWRQTDQIFIIFMSLSPLQMGIGKWHTNSAYSARRGLLVRADRCFGSSTSAVMYLAIEDLDLFSDRKLFR